MSSSMSRARRNGRWMCLCWLVAIPEPAPMPTACAAVAMTKKNGILTSSAMASRFRRRLAAGKVRRLAPKGRFLHSLAPP